MRRLIPIKLLALTCLLAACVTVNVYFPAAAAEQAADRIIDTVTSQQQKNNENNPPPKTPPNSRRAPKAEQPTVAANAGRTTEPMFMATAWRSDQPAILTTSARMDQLSTVTPARTEQRMVAAALAHTEQRMLAAALAHTEQRMLAAAPAHTEQRTLAAAPAHTEQPVLLAAAGAVLNFLIPAAQAQGSPNLDVSGPEIRAVTASMQQRFGQLQKYFQSGVIGLTTDGLVAIRDPNDVPLAERAVVTRLVTEDNRDRETLYAQLAKANKHPEWEPDIRRTFARRWVERGAQPGWYYQDSGGKWVQK